MRAGSLDREIVVERATAVVDEYGNEVMTWTPLVTLRAALLQQTGREFVTGGATFDERRAVFRTRYAPDLKTSDRIVYEGRRFDIGDIREIGRRHGLEFHAVDRGT